uniref:Uncharacterized protein n=1 Tax=Arion vulgaris TaxID=1028688 RepID=A0A0B7BWH0_9EUPU
MLSETIQKVKSYGQSGYDQMKMAANEIAENFECRTEFPAETEVRARNKKRQFDYEEVVNESVIEENKFKINVFNYIIIRIGKATLIWNKIKYGTASYLVLQMYVN